MGYQSSPISWYSSSRRQGKQRWSRRRCCTSGQSHRYSRRVLLLVRSTKALDSHAKLTHECVVIQPVSVSFGGLFSTFLRKYAVPNGRRSTLLHMLEFIHTSGSALAPFGLPESSSYEKNLDEPTASWECWRGACARSASL